MDVGDADIEEAADMIGSRGKGQPRAVVLLGPHDVELARQVSSDRSVGRDALDGVFQLVAPVSQFVGGEGGAAGDL
jgi:hypothetical protein